ncbi:hypothetical protein BDF14DRAFT_1456477 [Spinellus fusiger]|nr:hypothetical protein BDF14DRAFT_1456477 [Spinellus fusiger]
MPNNSKPSYICAKRGKVSLFLCYYPKDTIASIKSNLCTILKLDTKPEHVRLLTEENWPNKYRMLEEKLTAEKSALMNETIVYFVLFDTGKGQWEEVLVSNPEPLEDLDDVDVDMQDTIAATKKEEGKNKGKGKGRA